MMFYIFNVVVKVTPEEKNIYTTNLQLNAATLYLENVLHFQPWDRHTFKIKTCTKRLLTEIQNLKF